MNTLARFCAVWARQTIPPIEGVLEESFYTDTRTPLPKSLASRFLDLMARLWESLWQRRAQILQRDFDRDVRLLHLSNLAWMIQRAYRGNP